MPRDGYRKINIFIAAPSDVSTEKARIISIVEQLNHGLADKLDIVLEVKEWSQVMPNMGRSQQVIFNQLPVEQWDIMIGILWLRYGTPSGGQTQSSLEPMKNLLLHMKAGRKLENRRLCFISV